MNEGRAGGRSVALPLTNLTFALHDRNAKQYRALRRRDMDWDFSHMSVKVPSHEAWPVNFTHSIHLLERRCPELLSSPLHFFTCLGLGFVRGRP